MENIKRLGVLIDRATSDADDEIPLQLRQQILELVNSRVDMPKHAIALISKKFVVKNTNVLINTFNLLEYLSYECELSLYSQISTKEFLFKISGLLMNKEVNPAKVKDKIMQTVYCWEELFRPHEDLLPLFFQFYAGLLRNNFAIPYGYKSPFRPAKLKEYKKKQIQSTGPKQKQSKVQAPKPTLSQQQTFEQIREKLILTNEIIDGCSPVDSVKQNGLLLEMIEQIKQCEKKVTLTINQNPNEKIMELALAANDDIFITYRRFRDLQKNRKPEPFILTELVSDLVKEQQVKKTNKYYTNEPSIKPRREEKEQPVPKKEQPVPKKEVNILDMDDEPPFNPKTQITVAARVTVETKEANLFDMDFDVSPPEQKKKESIKGDIFDLLGEVEEQKVEPLPAQKKNSSIPDLMGFNGDYNDLLGTAQFQNVPVPSGYGITLNDSEFKTEADMKPYNDKSIVDKLEDMTYDFLKK